MQQRGALGDRRLHVQHGRQVVVVDDDQLGGVPGGGGVAGDDDGDALAREVHGVDGERRRCGAFWSGTIGQALGRLASAAEVAAVKTAMTPGSGRASSASMPVIRACAADERTTARCSMPGSVMLSVQRVRPVMRRASSLRTRDCRTRVRWWWDRR